MENLSTKYSYMSYFSFATNQLNVFHDIILNQYELLMIQVSLSFHFGNFSETK